MHAKRTAAPATASADEARFESKVRPILARACFSCHGKAKQESGLRLDTGELIRRGGDSGAAVVAGKAESSLLIERVAAKDASERMPPEGEPLAADQMAVLRRWIAEGAQTPRDERARRNDEWSGFG